MSNKTDVFWGALILGLVVGIIFMAGVDSLYYHRKAVRLDCGEYNSRTGYFEWIDRTNEGVFKP